MRSRAPEYSGSVELTPVKDPRALAAVGGEPAPSPTDSAAAPPTGVAPAAVAVPRLPGTPDTTKDGLYVFAGSGIELVVDPRSGSIVRLSLEGRNALAAVEPKVDAGTLNAEVEGSSLLLRSADGSLAKRFRLDTARRSVEMTYTTTNVSAKLGRFAIPDFQRVPSAGGLTFLPGTQRTIPLTTHPLAGEVPAAPLSLNVRQSVLWFPHDQNRATSLGEAYCDVREGWIATVNDGLLLVKSFDESTSHVIIDANYDRISKQHTWVEISDQAEILDVPAGTTITRTVRLFLRKLPPTIVVKPGNQELVGFVRGVIQ